MKENLNKHHLYSLDFLKFMAALMITNSHFQPVYEDVSTSLATFGVHGNALFFFVAGIRDRMLWIGIKQESEVSGPLYSCGRLLRLQYGT